MPNRLAQSQSLYLRKHAENPIDWWPWSDEALAKAKADKKPIFLSIGYSSCHWCTVMEGEAFSDPTIAEYMNANFLPIKVDREERPDIDSIYMQALQLLTGQGGWPLNVFLSSDDLVPFYGGTYFPREPRYGRPGFLQLLQALRRYHDTEPGKVRSLKEEILGYLQQAAILSTDDGTQELSQDLLRQGWETNTGVISGGSYGNPSFPMIPYAQLALQGTRFKFESKYDSEQACTQRGFDLALGGIYDHVAGGFHRYTVDSTWTVPHFEKMLYDNGQIVEYLASLWSAGVHEPAFERAIAGTVSWLKREMTAPEGYFWAAQDADSFTPPHQGVWSAEPEEGAFYVWSYDELARLLTVEELGELQQQFTVTVEGNFEGNNVLQRRHLGILSETIENALLKLFEFRYGTTASALETFPPARNNQEVKAGNWPGRIPPVTDTKMIVAWNSLTISGLARAGAVFRNSEYLSIAVKAARFILDNQFVDGRFYRINYDGKPSVLAQSEDYALFVKALLDLHQASLGLWTGNERHGDTGIRGHGDILTELSASASQFPIPNFWLEKALQVQEEFDNYLWSVELSGYYNTASDASSDLLVRERGYADNATPAANGVAIANLVQLAILTENLQFLDRSEQALQAFSGVMRRSPQACPSLFAALDWHLHCTLVRTTDSQIASLASQYLPTAIFSSETMPPGSVGLVCQGLSCLEPATSFEQMLEQVDRSQVRS